MGLVILADGVVQCTVNQSAYIVIITLAGHFLMPKNGLDGWISMDE
jgi:hypothetical protein